MLWAAVLWLGESKSSSPKSLGRLSNVCIFWAKLKALISSKVLSKPFAWSWAQFLLDFGANTILRNHSTELGQIQTFHIFSKSKAPPRFRSLTPFLSRVFSTLQIQIIWQHKLSIFSFSWLISKRLMVIEKLLEGWPQRLTPSNTLSYWSISQKPPRRTLWETWCALRVHFALSGCLHGHLQLRWVSSWGLLCDHMSLRGAPSAWSDPWSQASNG